MNRVPRIPLRKGLLAAIAVAALAAVACGTDDGGGGASSGNGIIQRVTDDGRTYTVNEIKTTGAKTPKEYDVSDLPGAVSAFRALWNQKEFEVRFYGSHEDAVALGTEWADIVSGDDAVVVGDGVRWEEGSKDRRQCNRAAETPHSGCSYTARYGDFVILGNMVLLCEGGDSRAALENCRDFILELDQPVA